MLGNNKLSLFSILVGLGLLASGRLSLAAISPAAATSYSSSASGGVIFGGRSDQEFSLLGVKSLHAVGKEQVIISYGDRLGRVQEGEPGFYHIALDRGAKRVVIDLAQVSRTAVDPKDLARIFASSPLVESTDMTMDPQDGSTNITLNLRAPVEIKARSDRKGGARLLIDMSVVGTNGVTPGRKGDGNALKR